MAFLTRLHVLKNILALKLCKQQTEIVCNYFTMFCKFSKWLSVVNFRLLAQSSESKNCGKLDGDM